MQKYIQHPILDYLIISLLYCSYTVQFQKISIPTPWKLEGVGCLKSQNVKRKVWDLTEISGGMGVQTSTGGVSIFSGTTHSRLSLSKAQMLKKENDNNNNIKFYKNNFTCREV